MADNQIDTQRDAAIAAAATVARRYRVALERAERLKSERDAAIRAATELGASRRAIARATNVTYARVDQIVRGR